MAYFNWFCQDGSPPCKVFDLNDGGKEIEALWADTETGECGKVVGRDEYGIPKVLRIKTNLRIVPVGEATENAKY